MQGAMLDFMVGEQKKKQLAVFASGSGTNLENLAEQIKRGTLEHCEIALVLSDRPQAFALDRAKKYGLKTAVVQREKFSDKAGFDIAILNELNKCGHIDFIVLAGYMRIVGNSILEKYKDRIVNIHPALLPHFPGAHAIRDAWEAKAKETGATVHFVDSGIDTGPVILQEKVKIDSRDSFESLEAKIHAVEYALYPKALQWLVDGKLRIVNGKVVMMDGSPGKKGNVEAT